MKSLEYFSTRIEEGLKHKLHVFCAVNKITVQDATTQAIKEWIEKNEGVKVNE